MAKTIGILYLCTGPYKLFWDDFYKSIEANFLPKTKKKYFVFCDDFDGCFDSYKGKENVVLIHIESMPWPLITLLRFKYFLTQEDLISKCDYLMFSNANMICESPVSEEDFLPRAEQGEKLSFVKHPGFVNRRSCNCPFERRKASLAYIPYNIKSPYVIGAMFAGEATDFLRMCHILNERISIDLRKNIIAQWHDESHLNRYIVGRTDSRILSPSYCYPYGFDLPFERKLAAVSKTAKFDVEGFKGTRPEGKSVRTQAKRLLKRMRKVGYLECIRDFLLFKHLETL